MDISSIWQPPPYSHILKSDEVHVWRLDLDLPNDLLQSLEDNLSEDERDRAGRFHFLQDRSHFISARGGLRFMLGYYLDIPPAELRFCYSSYGKPSLGVEFEGQALSFNVSYSGGVGLIGIAPGRRVGVDIEQIRPDLADEQIAKRFFSASEVSALLTLPLDQRKEAFFTCWTRKEAYIKARGEGLSLPLNCFDVSLAPGEPAALLGTRCDPEEVQSWQLHDIYPGTGYVAALAVERGPVNLKYWKWVEGGFKHGKHDS